MQHEEIKKRRKKARKDIMPVRSGVGIKK